MIVQSIGCSLGCSHSRLGKTSERREQFGPERRLNSGDDVLDPSPTMEWAPWAQHPDPCDLLVAKVAPGPGAAICERPDRCIWCALVLLMPNWGEQANVAELAGALSERSVRRD